MRAEDAPLVLSRREVTQLLGPDDCAAAVEDALRRRAEGRWAPTAVMGVAAPRGRFHVKAAASDLGGAWFAAKVNANFPANPCEAGLPTIQGVIVLCDATNGRVLAIMDSMEITSLRTAAATAVAAKHLARADSRVVTVWGCGVQGRAQLRALARVLPLQRVHAYDTDPERAGHYAAELSAELGLEVVVTAEPHRATRASDLCVTCTTSRRAFLGPDDVRPGTFVAAVGADSEDKQELTPALLARSTVVADITEQCAVIGDLHHAIAAGAMRREDVHAELGEILAGRRPGRRSADEIIVFDSTGTALQDVAVAALAYQRALAQGVGTAIRLA